MSDKPEITYVYFQGETLARLVRELVEVQGTPGAQLEVHGPLGRHTYLRVVAEGYDGEDLNNSHPCPGSPGCGGT